MMFVDFSRPVCVLRSESPLHKVAVSGLLWFGGWRVLLAAATPVGLEGTVTASGPLLFGRDGFQSS